MCKNFANGHCRYGAACQFAHGTPELRSPPAKNPVRDWDEEEEDWGDTPATPAYNPMKKIEQARGSILHNPMNVQRCVQFKHSRFVAGLTNSFAVGPRLRELCSIHFSTSETGFEQSRVTLAVNRSVHGCI